MSILRSWHPPKAQSYQQCSPQKPHFRAAQGRKFASNSAPSSSGAADKRVFAGWAEMAASKAGSPAFPTRTLSRSQVGRHPKARPWRATGRQSRKRARFLRVDFFMVKLRCCAACSEGLSGARMSQGSDRHRRTLLSPYSSYPVPPLVSSPFLIFQPHPSNHQHHHHHQPPTPPQDWNRPCMLVGRPVAACMRGIRRACALVAAELGVELQAVVVVAGLRRGGRIFAGE